MIGRTSEGKLLGEQKARSIDYRLWLIGQVAAGYGLVDADDTPDEIAKQIIEVVDSLLEQEAFEP